ncbi:MAG TPA: hypothetical protein VFF65_05110 [Phycisphaerales bacterium]|nr:hypothetical protein [Phycisphaerales bacterium]
MLSAHAATHTTSIALAVHMTARPSRLVRARCFTPRAPSHTPGTDR